MKKVFRFLTVFVTVAAYACLFTSCSKDDLDDLSFLYTTWYLDDDADETLTFSKNGTYVWRYGTANGNLAEVVEKGTFTIKATPNGKLNYRLTCTYTDEGEECTDVYDVVDFDMGDYRILELYMIGGEDYSPTFVNNKKYVESHEYTGNNNKFKACAFVAMPSYSEDLRNLLDITVTYTAMDGTVKELKADKDGSFIAEDASYTLPANVKFVVKSVKSANYEAYKASKSTFDLRYLAPGYIAAWINQEGQEFLADKNTSSGGVLGLKAEEVDDFIREFDKYFNFTFEGTFKNSKNGSCYFEVKK